MANRNVSPPTKSYVKFINPKRVVPFQIRSLRLGFKIMSGLSTSLATKMAIKMFYKPRKSSLRENEKEKLKEAKTFTFMYKKFKLQTYTWGEGKNLLFLHGWDGKGIDFFKMIDPLVNIGFRITIVDMPGHGKSTGNNIDMSDFIGSILLMQEKFGIFYGVVAHSFGGLATLYSLLRKKLSIEKLVLISSPASVDTVMESFKAILKLKTEIIENIRIDAHKRTQLPLWNYPSDSDLKSINVPILIIHDEYDMIIPNENAIRLKTYLNGSKLIKTKDLGHQKILRDPQVISNVINFLN